MDKQTILITLKYKAMGDVRCGHCTWIGAVSKLVDKGVGNGHVNCPDCGSDEVYHDEELGC